MTEQSTERKETFCQSEQLNTENEKLTETNSELAAEIEPPMSFIKKKKRILIASAIVVIIAILALLLIPSKFKRVKNECVQIAGRISGGSDYFTIDTYPDEYERMDETMVAILLPSTQDNALEAIKYANSELGFNGSVYSQMMKTTALMGRQSAENKKYRVTWSYHPDDGLEVTYEKK